MTARKKPKTTRPSRKSSTKPTGGASAKSASRSRKLDSAVARANAKSAATEIDLARGQAVAVLKMRQKAIGTRTRALAKRAAQAKGAVALSTTAVSPALLRAVGGGASAGVLVAEGDSWFDYPWTDVLGELEDRHGYDIESVAKAGDRVEDMAYNDGQLAKFVRAIEKVVRRGSIPRAILLSGGGNDIAGHEFATLLNHAQSASPGLNAEIVQATIHGRIRGAYVHIIEAIAAVTSGLVGQRIPLVVHGYGYPVPDGRGFWGGWWLLPGPWMEPGFRSKGYQDLQQRTDLAKLLIDEFNTMLIDIASMPNFAHVSYVDLRPALSNDLKSYKKSWANELHPTERGFSTVTDLIAAVLP